MDQNDAKEFLNLAESIALLGTWEFTLETQKLRWSDGVFQMFGYLPNEFEVTVESALAIIHPEDRSGAIEKMTETIADGAPYESKKRFIKKDKTVIHVLSKARLIKNEDGKAVKLFGVFQDISDMVKLEQEHQTAISKLNTRNQFIETVIENLPIGIAVNKISTGESTIVNKSFSSIYGWDAEELTSVDDYFNKVFPDKAYREKLKDRVLTDIQSGDAARMHWENIKVTTSKNETRIVNAKNIPLFEQDLMISTVVDQTDSVNSARKYQYLFQNNPAMMMVLDVNTFEILDGNEAVLQKYGYSREELLALTIKDIRPSEDAALLEGLFVSDESYSNIFEQTWRHQKKNGDLFSVEISGRMIDYEGRKCSLVQLTDVTEKLLIEKNLKESEEKYKQLFEDNPAPMLVWDCETTHIVDCNVEALHLYGYSREEFLQLSILNIRPEEDIPLIQHVLKNNNTYGAIQKNSLRHKKKNGDLFYVDITGHLIRYKGRKCSLAMLNDVTKQQEYELTIEENNQRFEYVTKATSDAIWDWHFDQEHLYWGGGFYQLFGYSVTATQNNIDFWAEKIHPEDADKVVKSLYEIIRGTEEKWSSEYRFKKANGDYAYVADQGFVIRDSEGKAIRMVGAMRDITIKKKEVERLKLLESVITNTNDSVLITEAEPFGHTGHPIVYVNNAFTKMTGYSAEEVIGKTPDLLRGPLSDKKELKRLGKAVGNWEPCQITTANYRKNGTPFWVNLSVSPVANDKGLYTHWIAIERDVTEQKIAEDKLKKALLEKDEILESIGDGFFAVNQDWTVTYWNKKVEKILGVSRKKIIGNNLWKIFPERVRSKTYVKYQEAMTKRQLLRFEDYFETLDSWCEISIYPSDTGLSIYLKDISEMVKHTKAIEENNKTLKEIAYTQSHIVRAPLAKILGLTGLIKELDCATQESKDLCDYLSASATELDDVIREIVRKTEDV